ncbi:MAG: TraM recognition domain-containing protein [Clostridia bacterium]|nr:TraM recognition domain-containing protein [Clostridia bacterium]
MKLLDSFLKILKTDRNTFFTFVLSICSVYIIVDRLIEFFLIVFTGVAFEYWGPITYAIAYAFPVFAFLFSFPSKFVKRDVDKITLFISYCITLYILFIIMITEWINKLCWIGLLSLPGYTTIVTEFAFLIKPAFSSMALFLPLATWSSLFKKLYMNFMQTNLLQKSLFDFGGINLSDTSIGWGPYTNEVKFGTDKKTGATVKLPEIRRFESTLVVGVSGAGKTTLIFEPMVAQDINKKFFFRETSKTLAIAALRTGIATLNAPYNNQYINKNFSLNMLKPVESKKVLFNSYFKKMILTDSGSNIIYKNLGITYMSPDYETIGKIKDVCENFGLSYNMIDPDNPNSIGLNPFSFEDPVQSALLISSVLKGFYSDRNPEVELAYRENLSTQIIENLAILLKVMYPKLNSGKIPTIDDMLKFLNNFDLIEKMCQILEQDPDLAYQYQNQIGYFKKNFYRNSPNRAEMEKIVSIPMSQLDTLLRYPGVKRILCNRTHNINYDNVLENGEINLVCTRRGDLGENAHKAFGLFFLLLMQFSVLRRPGNEKSRIPHFLYIDEFPDFICPSTESIFTVYRKYRIATVVSAQNLDQIRAKGEKMGNTIIANCSNKFVFGNNSPQDNDWWSKEIGQKKDWTIDRKGFDFSSETYVDKGNVSLDFKDKLTAGKIQKLGFKTCAYKVRDLGGRISNGVAKLDFMEEKYNEKQKIKTFDFKRFSNGITQEDTTGKFNLLKSINSHNPLANSHFSDEAQEDGNPIKLDTSNLNFNINNDDAITFTFKKDKK